MTLLPWKHAARESTPPASAFEDLAMPLFPALYNIAHWLSRSPTDAEDLVQETFLKALRGFSTFEPGTNFKAWIFRILRNTWLTSRTGLAARSTVSLEDELIDSAAPASTIDYQTPEMNLMRLSDQAALHAAMENLSPSLLEVLLLCDVEDLKYREISTVLEIPIGTVMSRLARARAALRASLQPAQIQPREIRS